MLPLSDKAISDTLRTQNGPSCAGPCKLLIFGCGGRIRTYDLQVMSLTAKMLTEGTGLYTPSPILRAANQITNEPLFWVLLSRLWPAWREALVIVKPETVIAWHRKGFRLLWTWKSRRRKGGPSPAEVSNGGSL